MNLKSNQSTSNNHQKDQYVRLSETADQGNNEIASTPKTKGSAIKIVWKPTHEMFSNWKGYIWNLLLIAMITVVGQLASAVFSLENIVLFYLLVVVISSIYWGLGPSIMASFLTIVVLDYFFIPPVLGFIPFRPNDVFTLVVLLIVCVLISYLATNFRQKSEEAKRHEREVSTLYFISRNLSNFTELDSSVHTILQMSKSILDIDTAIFLPDTQNENSLIPYSIDPEYSPDSQVVWVAHWSFQNRLIAGRGTNVYKDMRDRFLPLITPRGAVGIMVLRNPGGSSVPLSSSQTRLIQAFADLIAVCIENIRLAEEANKAEVFKAKEKLQTAILNSISHDLRTPLVSIIGVLSSLQEEGMDLDEIARRNLIQVAYEDANKLNNLIANLLDISRIEAGAVQLFKQPSDISELIGVALERLENSVTKHKIEIYLPAEMPFINVDSGLFVQVFYNILDNALKYSREDSSIEIKAQQVGREIEIEFADHGIGIPPQDLPHVFDKFYRGQGNQRVSGTGLGLSICKGIVESHGGHIVAENCPGGGTVIKITLPISPSAIEIQEQNK